MAVQLPPVVKTSKRTIPGTRTFNPANIFADYSLTLGSSRETFSSHYQSTFAHSHRNASCQPHRAGKVNQPDPTNVHFLFENPRFVNEPVCHASTKIAREKQHLWWPSEIPLEVRLKPTYSSNTTSRCDFKSPDKRPIGLTRFSCVDGKRMAAMGIVPVTELPSRHVKTEKISYNHQFDSRRERRERGKLHGSFVWDTSGTTVSQKSRRFAKKHFACSDSGDITTPLPTSTAMKERTIIDPNESYSSKPIEGLSSNKGTSSATEIAIEADESNLKLPVFDTSAKTTNPGYYTEIFAHREQKPISKEERMRRKYDSPPPHLC